LKIASLKTREYSTFPYRAGVYRMDDDFDEHDDDPFLDDYDDGEDEE
jgi:hypothetical protein